MGKHKEIEKLPEIGGDQRNMSINAMWDPGLDSKQTNKQNRAVVEKLSKFKYSFLSQYC